MRLEITIPTYNESDQINNTIATLLDYCEKNLKEYDYKLIVGENGSTDNTYETALNKYGTHPKVKVLKLPIIGRGRALMKIWGESEADLSMYMDTDLSTDIKHIKPVVEAVASGTYDIAIGSRLLATSQTTRGPLRDFVGKVNVGIVQLTFGSKLTDYNCGFKIANRQTIQKVFPLIDMNGWDINGSAWFWDTEFLIIAEKLGFKIYQEGVKWDDDPGTTVKLWRDSIESLKGVFRLAKAKPWQKATH